MHLARTASDVLSDKLVTNWFQIVLYIFYFHPKPWGNDPI